MPEAGGHHVGEHLRRLTRHRFGRDAQSQPVPQRLSRGCGHADPLEPLLGGDVGQVGGLVQGLPAQAQGRAGRAQPVADAGVGMHPEQHPHGAPARGLHGHLASVGPAQCRTLREGDVLAGPDAGEVAEQVLVSAGDDVLAVVGHVVDRLRAHRVSAAAEATPTFQQRDVLTRLGQPHRGGEARQATSDDHISPTVAHPLNLHFVSN